MTIDVRCVYYWSRLAHAIQRHIQAASCNQESLLNRPHGYLANDTQIGKEFIAHIAHPQLMTVPK
ncbi:hypothetical protein DL98DRAFT_69818 [Cadophora sp. DSE1049]|nr:hypothetical protein DL98DRAFT_69818 [Cadophora sp. DSE1049]